MGDTKNKHHYVWKHYLKAWAVKDRLWVRRCNGRVHGANINNVAAQRRFHEVEPMSNTDLAFLEGWMRRLDGDLRDLCEGWLPMFLAPQYVASEMDRQGVKDEARRAELERHRVQLVEDMMAQYEGAAVPLLARLRDGDLSFWHRAESKDAVSLFCFLALQYFRTKRRRNPRVAAIEREFGHLGVNGQAVANPLTWIYATSMGQSFYLSRQHHQVALLDAPPGTEFLGSDQPIINRLSSDVPDAAVELFYPLGPSRALVLTVGRDSPAQIVRRATAEEVARLNSELTAESAEIVFAKTREILNAEGA